MILQVSPCQFCMGPQPRSFHKGNGKGDHPVILSDNHWGVQSPQHQLPWNHSEVFVFLGLINKLYIHTMSTKRMANIVRFCLFVSGSNPSLSPSICMRIRKLVLVKEFSLPAWTSSLKTSTWKLNPKQNDPKCVYGIKPAPVERQFIPLFTGFYTSQAVQDFFHQQ